MRMALSCAPRRGGSSNGQRVESPPGMSQIESVMAKLLDRHRLERHAAFGERAVIGHEQDEARGHRRREQELRDSDGQRSPQMHHRGRSAGSMRRAEI